MRKNKESRSNFFGENDEKWNWKDFKTTESFPISPNLIDWVIGQERAIRETKLCIDEWISKLNWLKKREWWKAFEIKEVRQEVKFFGHHLFWLKRKKYIFNPKSNAKEYLPSGPFLMLLGDAGTGKSLIGRAMAAYMTEVYNKHNVVLYDVCTWFNKTMPSEPKISIHPTPQGTKIVEKAHKQEQKKGRVFRWFFKGVMALMVGLGLFILGYISIGALWDWFTNPVIVESITTGPVYIQSQGFLSYMIAIILGDLQLIMAGVMCLSMGLMLYIFSRMFGSMGGAGKKGIGGAESTKAPKLLIDNSGGTAPFIDATGHGSAQLFGSIAWDPYQTGDLGTPEHQRVTAGDVHRAHLGILYIDEIKNLVGAEATTLLTVLEDGQLPVTLRSHSGISGDTAAMAVSTEPIPCMNFFIAAGNMDSVPQIHPALMDRIRGYGKLVYMNNDMPNTIENRRKYVQFMAQEIKRFNLLPFSREACIAVIVEARRKSGKNMKLTCKFRPMISVIKTASTLAMNEGLKAVEVKQVKEALCEHCKSIQQQVLERDIENMSLYRLINPNDSPKVGQIYGMAVTEMDEETLIGAISPIKASMVKKKNRKIIVSYFNVTGVNEEEGSWVQNSIAKVRHVFLQLYSKDPAIDFDTHIDFAQDIGVDGPSAGAAMTLVLISLFTKKKIRQDVAVTGEINIGIDGKIAITPIGGTFEKITAAEKFGFKKVCIPRKNYDNSIVPSEFKIKIVPCDTIEDYMRECLVD